jgi:predicted GTPase
VLKISALSGKGVQRLLPSLGETITDYHTRVPTAKVNRVIVMWGVPKTTRSQEKYRGWRTNP